MKIGERGLILIVACGLLWAISPVGGTLAAPLNFPSMQEPPPYPAEGWLVCADLGVGPVPGLPGDVQRLELCQGAGWRIQVYCLEPQEPAPPINSACSHVGGGTFWCGDNFQLLQEYQVVETPAPTSTATSTPSNTPTPTSTSTATATVTATATPTITITTSATITPTGLPTSSATVTPTQTMPPVVSETSVSPTETTAASATLFVRPAPGGPGNRGFIGGLAILALMMVFTGAGGLWFAHRIHRT